MPDKENDGMGMKGLGEVGLILHYDELTEKGSTEISSEDKIGSKDI